ncbi:hypothetical protein BH09SUM1_BH09SUM1_22300 [soil metagenome]
MQTEPPPPAIAETADLSIERKQAPDGGKGFPCSNCGAMMLFEPGAQSLKCPYCGHEQAVPQAANEVHEIPFEQFARTSEVATEVLEVVKGERRCTGCGAMVTIPYNVATDLCPFCAKPMENPLSSATPMMAPAGVLPFKITEPQARGAFKQWISSRWFAPTTFRRMADLGRVSGLYVPYWTYDAMTWSFYTGSRGDYYYVTVGSGKDKRTERRTRWTSVSGKVDQWFDDVLVCASKTLPGDLIAELEPWDVKEMQPFKPDFITGFRSERYQLSGEQGYVEAKVIMDDRIRSLIRRDIGGDEQSISEVRTQYDGVTFKNVLLPIWLAAYQYHGKTFRVLINARTGEVQGTRPWSVWKITLTVIAGLLIVLIIIAIARGR